ncbi:MAG TPA: hypothetical protein VF258_08160 [Luteolibacter sp.]
MTGKEFTGFLPHHQLRLFIPDMREREPILVCKKMIIRRTIEQLKRWVMSQIGSPKMPDPPKYHIATLDLQNLTPMKDLWDKRALRLSLTTVNSSGSQQEIAYRFRDIGLGVGDIWVEAAPQPQSFEVYSTGDLDLVLFEAEASQIQWLDSVWPIIWPKCLEAAQAHQVDYGRPITEEASSEYVSISPPGDYIDYDTEWWTFSFCSSGTFTVSFDDSLEIQDVGVAF